METVRDNYQNGDLTRMVRLETMLLEKPSDWKPWQLYCRNNCQPGNHGNWFTETFLSLETMETMLQEQLSDWKP